MIKPVGVLVFTEDHIFIPMHDFNTLVRPIESQHPVGIRVFKTANLPDSFIFGLGNVPFFHVFSLSIYPVEKRGMVTPQGRIST